jgi:glycosyltransferase involved in cell wall biosynthesis
MAKINVLVVPSDRFGVGKFRSVDPHTMLQKLYGDDFHVDIDYEPKFSDANYWKNYQIVHFHRTLGPYEQCPQLLEVLKSMGIITILDIDDYWLPTKEHPVYQLVLANKLDTLIKNNIKAVQYVTTTTPIFAEEIRKINKNVFVFPNAVNPEEPQFKEPTLESDKLRFGWLGGSSHLHDLELLTGTFSKLQQFKDQYQLFLCGFDLRGTVTEINQQTKEQRQRPILPHETVWAKYEAIFTDNYRLISQEHKDFLLQWKDEQYPGGYQFYNRVWTKPVTSYARNYSLFDVSLVPIKNHMFNRMKSQLKVIEAGFYKKAIIASDLGPYQIDLKHSLNQGNFVDGNALLVEEKRNHSDWAYNIKKLIQNPTWAEDLGNRLYETVKDTYSLQNVTKNRAEFYKSLIK